MLLCQACFCHLSFFLGFVILLLILWNSTQSLLRTYVSLGPSAFLDVSSIVVGLSQSCYLKAIRMLSFSVLYWSRWCAYSYQRPLDHSGRNSPTDSLVTQFSTLYVIQTTLIWVHLIRLPIGYWECNSIIHMCLFSEGLFVWMIILSPWKEVNMCQFALK